MAVITSSEVINTGYAVLALIADALVVLAAIAFIVSRTSPSGREWWGRLRDGISPIALHLAWIVAVLATFGSLFLQFYEGLQPCEFCWFQRICMYPLSLLLGIAALRGDVQVAKRYFIGLPIVGVGLAVYHYQLELFPNQPTACSNSGPPCNIAVINVFGFISVPFLSMAAFALIATLLLMARGRSDDDYEEIDVEGTVEIDSDDNAITAPA